MIPRFSNPALLQNVTKITSRAELYGPDLDNDDHTINDERLKRLRELVLDSLGDPASYTLVESHRRKRRKVQESSESGENESNPIPFRLLSNSLAPQPILLAPKPPPPVLSIEPEYEDDETQAEQRKKRAQSVAVSSDWVIQESKKLYPAVHNKKSFSLKTSAPFSITPTAIMIKKPLPGDSRLSLSTIHLPPLSSNSSHIACLDGPLISDKHTEGSKSLRMTNSRSRHRRRKSATNQRPQPTFWRHDPAVRGKSLGYALGYPGNWTAYNSARGPKRYERDTMRKGIHIDTF